MAHFVTDLTTTETEAILTLCLIAAFADGVDREDLAISIIEFGR